MCLKVIDIESKVFNCISTPLKKAFKDIIVIGEFIKSPPKFPCVTIIERENSVYTNSQDDSTENHANLMYEINVYSNKITGKKSECRNIISAIDNEFQKIGFTRKFMQSIDNIEDYSIYRIVARFTGIADKNNFIYRK